MRPIHLAPWLCVACIGELDNRPFREGVASINGRLEASVDPSTAWAVIVDQPQLKASVGQDGRFTIENVPSGTRQIAVSSGLASAALATVHVFSGRRTEIALPAAPAMIISGRVTLVPPTESCTLYASLPAYGVTQAVHAGGEFRLTGIPGPAIDLSLVAYAECSGGLLFKTEERVLGGEPGQTFAEDFHLGRIAMCAACTADSDCGRGVCMSKRGEKFCAAACTDAASCAQDFVCETARGGPRACVPMNDNSCAAFADLLEGTTCGDDAACGRHNIADGVCSGLGACTVACQGEGDSSCPTGFRCHADTHTGGVCAH